jgi:hypothetical protein
VAVGRWMIVSTDPTNKVIIEGPVLWDGVTPLPLPPGQRMITEADALAGGYIPAPRPIMEVNDAALRERARQALESNTAYLALPAPTAAQQTQQVARLTRQLTAVVRVLTRATETTDGT